MTIKNFFEKLILLRSKSKVIRNFNRNSKPFDYIINDFFYDIDFRNKFILDMGPGQYDFFELIKNKTNNLFSIDKDKAVVNLGKYRKYNSQLLDIKNIAQMDYINFFDIIFCKFSINAFWFHDNDDLHNEVIIKISSMLKKNGSAWIAPWNGLNKKLLNKKQINHLLDFQIKSFKKVGFNAYYPSKSEINRYGINGMVENNIIFFKNINFINQSS